MLGGGAFLDALETEFRRLARKFYDLSHCIPAETPLSLTRSASDGERISHSRIETPNRSAAFTPLPCSEALRHRMLKRRKRRAPDVRFIGQDRGKGLVHITRLSVSFPWP